MEITDKAVVCVNLLDEAKRKNISVDLKKLSGILGVPVVGISARSGKGLEELKDAVGKVAGGDDMSKRWLALCRIGTGQLQDAIVSTIVAVSEQIAQKTVVTAENAGRRERPCWGWYKAPKKPVHQRISYSIKDRIKLSSSRSFKIFGTG